MNDMAHYRTEIIWFKACLQDQLLCDKLRKLTLVVTDVDGSMTDETLTYSVSEEQTRSFSVQDGLGIKQARQAGLEIIFASGKSHQSACVRAEVLGVPLEHCILGQDDKVAVLAEIMKQMNRSIHEIAMFGDDHLDVRVKLAYSEIVFAAPSNLPFYYYHLADIVIPRDGGHHALRYFLDLILFVQKKHWAQDIITAALH